MEQTATINSLAQDISELTTFLQRRFLIDITRKVTQTKISIPQFTLLGFLSVQESLNMGQLADLMGHTTPATTGLIDRLSEAGLVERFHDAQDRRKVMVKITPQGRRIVQDMKDDLAHCITKILERLTPEEGATWLKIYRTINEYRCELKAAPSESHGS